MIDPELRKFVANLRPVEYGTCPTCGRDHVMLHRHLSLASTVRQCMQCWQEHRDGVPPPPVPERRVVVAQGTLTDLETRVARLEEWMEQFLQEREAQGKRPKR